MNLSAGLWRLWVTFALLSGLAMITIAALAWSELVNGPDTPVNYFSARLSLIGGALGVLFAGALAVNRQDKLSRRPDISLGARWASTGSVVLFPLAAVAAYAFHCLCVVSIFHGWSCPWGNFQAIGLFGGGFGGFLIACIIMLTLHGITRTTCWIAEGFLV
jgi:hypothetical protein